jgi:type IV pilus assembly protein PilA
MSRPRSDAADGGFTLIELMVVVLVIAVLLAIAIPTFMAARDRASDRLAQTSLRTALNTARVVYSDKQSFALANEVGLTAEDASIRFLAASDPSDAGTKVSVDGSTVTTWYAAAWSKSGTCFFLQDTGGSVPTSYLSSTTLACNADTATVNSGSFDAAGW